MDLGQILGGLALFFGVTSTFAYLHQAWTIWRRKSSKDVSIFTFAYFFAGQCVMLLYSVYIKDMVYVITWIANMTGSGMVIWLALYYRRPGKAVESKE